MPGIVRILKVVKLFLDEKIEVYSSYALQLFPESNGIIKGKQKVIDYIKFLFLSMLDAEAAEFEVKDQGDFFNRKSR